MTTTLRTPEAEVEIVQQRLDELVARHHGRSCSRADYLGAQFDAGLAWVHFPEGHGGLGLSPRLQQTINERLASEGFESPYVMNPMGIGMAGPTIVVHGSEGQRKRYLRSCFTCEDIWCQLFSEPGAGSDVANLSTTAVRDGDGWLINGQKVWTSLAHQARFGLLLTRTDPHAPKHKGLTYFVVDMRDPGVQVRPIRQMDGGTHFNEVFFTDVRIPDTDRLSAVGEGWQTALTTLMNERTVIGGAAALPRGSGHIARAIELWKSDDGNRAERDRFMRLWIRAEVGRLTAIRSEQNRAAGVPGPEGSIGKLTGGELEGAIYDFCLDLLGMEGILYPGFGADHPDATLGSAYEDLRTAFLFCRHVTIAGGTSEIMRNILGERVLGLPSEVRVDKDVPWNETLRS